MNMAQPSDAEFLLEQGWSDCISGDEFDDAVGAPQNRPAGYKTKLRAKSKAAKKARRRNRKR